MNNKLDWISMYNKENNNEYANFVFTGKYLAIQNPSHPRARNDGYVYIHQLQAEKKLGRILNKEECVHHIDENKYNNDIENLMVFKTISDHAAFHHGCEIYLDGDVWVAKKYKNNTCPICKTNKKNFRSTMCIECYSKMKAIRIPSKEILADLIFNCSFTQIGRIYGVDGNSVKKMV